MEPRLVAAMVSSLVSQALLLLLLSSLPSPTSLTLLPSFSPPPPHHPLLPLLFHLLTSTQIASYASFLSPKRKRPRTHQENPETGVSIGGDGEFAINLRPNPDHFMLSFRMTSSTFEWLSGLLDPLLDCRDPAGAALRLSGPARLAIALSRLASGAPYCDVARRFGVPEGAARFCAKHFCRVLCTNFRFWLAFPAPSDLSLISTAFLSVSGGLPNCCGAIACSRFEARRGAIAAQIVVDASSRIISIAAGFRGDRSDFEVLRCSSLYKDLEGGRLLGSNQYLVGDGGYPLLPWLMVPFADPANGSCEEDFNAVHQLMCRPVRRVASSLRNWGVLSQLAEEEDPKVAVACIGTCAMLHNVLLMREDYSAITDEDKGSKDRVEHCRGGAKVGDLEAEGRASIFRSTLTLIARKVRHPDHLLSA